MINFNGKLIDDKVSIFTIENRAFKYGDAVFETLKVLDLKIIFLEDHYFRLMASMRMLRMEIPADFTLEYVESEVVKVLKSNGLINKARVRLTVFRKDGGLYSPVVNDIDFVIQVSNLNVELKKKYEVDLYKDFYVQASLLSTIKTTNRLLNVVASVFAQENDLDSCILINDKKQLVEAIHSNLFIVKGNTISTPALTEGCIKGVLRSKIVELLQNEDKYKIEEREISPFELKKADEVFLTNSIINIQPVTHYRKKIFETVVSSEIRDLLEKVKF
jgi:branched-chain amino acid aminotransferase